MGAGCCLGKGWVAGGLDSRARAVGQPGTIGEALSTALEFLSVQHIC